MGEGVGKELMATSKFEQIDHVICYQNIKKRKLGRFGRACHAWEIFKNKNRDNNDFTFEVGNFDRNCHNTKVFYKYMFNEESDCKKLCRELRNILTPCNTFSVLHLRLLKQ